MGEVFRARDRVSGELVAVKVMAERREHRTARFARENELLAELPHPGIVRYVAHGETASGKLFLAMEWLDGEDLEARLEREPLTTGEAVTLATRVAEALGAAGTLGLWRNKRNRVFQWRSSIACRKRGVGDGLRNPTKR